MGNRLDKALDRDVARLAAGQWGVISLAELRACGLSEKAVGHRVRQGRLHRLHQGVFAVGHPAVPLEGRFLAALKAGGPDATLSHASAAVLWGILEPEEHPPDITVLPTGTRLVRGVRVHRAPLGPQDRSWRNGFPLTAPARTLVDLASMLPSQRLRRATSQVLSLRLATVPDVLAALDRAGPWRGRRTLARILATGAAPTRSELEDVVLQLIRRGGFAPPDVNVGLHLSGRRVIPDFRWPAARLVVEADGAAWHEHQLAREDDAERQALLERHGERVLRVTWAQAVTRPAETIARLRAAGAPPDA